MYPCTEEDTFAIADCEMGLGSLRGGKGCKLCCLRCLTAKHTFLQVLSKTLDSTALTPEKVELATLVHDSGTDSVSVASQVLSSNSEGTFGVLYA